MSGTDYGKSEMKHREELMLSDKRWRKDRDELGWVLPPPAAWPLRLWGVRHIRALYGAVQCERHYTMGFGAFGFRSGYDEWVIYAISGGW